MEISLIKYRETEIKECRNYYNFFLECTLRVNVLYAIFYFLLMISCPLTISQKIIYDAITHKSHRNKFQRGMTCGSSLSGDQCYKITFYSPDDKLI